MTRTDMADALGYYAADEARLDPQGIDAEPPTLFYPEEGVADERRPVALAGAGIPNGRCSADGIEIDCAVSNQMMAHGMLAECPEGDCGPRWNPRAGAFEYVEAYGDGYVGRVGADEVYLGGGVVRHEGTRRLDRQPPLLVLPSPLSSFIAPQNNLTDCQRSGEG